MEYGKNQMVFHKNNMYIGGKEHEKNDVGVHGSSHGVLHGCLRQQNAGDSQVEITWWHAMSGVNEEAIQKIADDFMAGRPDVKVTLVNQGGYLDLFDKLMASAKADQLPTMAQVYSNRLSWYISKDLVEDLTPYMQAEGAGFIQEDYDDIPKMFFDDGIWDGKQYAMPFNKSMMVLYYNEGGRRGGSHDMGRMGSCQ